LFAFRTCQAASLTCGGPLEVVIAHRAPEAGAMSARAKSLVPLKSQRGSLQSLGDAEGHFGDGTDHSARSTDDLHCIRCHGRFRGPGARVGGASQSSCPDGSAMCGWSRRVFCRGHRFEPLATGLSATSLRHHGTMCVFEERKTSARSASIFFFLCPHPKVVWWGERASLPRHFNSAGAIPAPPAHDRSAASVMIKPKVLDSVIRRFGCGPAVASESTGACGRTHLYGAPDPSNRHPMPRQTCADGR